MRKISKLRRSIKAISPIISVLLLIAIAVVASLVVYAWVMGYIGGSTTKAGYAINIQSFAVNQTTGYLIVYVQNVGIGAVQLNPLNAVYVNSTLYSIVTWNGNPAPTNGGLITLAQGQTEALAISYSYTGGQVTIKVVTTSGAFAQVTGTPSSGSTLYQVTFGTSGGGGDSTTSPSTTQFYTAGQQVGIGATAASGYTFSSWTTTGPITVADASSASTTATVNGAGTITAIFTQTNYQVTFSTSGGGSDSTTSPSGTESYTAGQQVSISATTGADHTFSDWSATGSITFADASSASTTATVNGGGTITANFVNSVASIIISPTPSTIPAGGSQSYTATAYDQNGVSMGTVTSSATFSVNGVSISGSSVTETAAGSYTVTASYDGITSNSAILQVSAGAAASFVIANINSPVVAGTNFTVSITAEDAYGNLAIGFTSSAVLTDETSMNPVTTGAFNDGQWFGPVNVTVTSPADVIYATDSSSNPPMIGNSNSFVVDPAALGSFAFGTIEVGNQIAGTSFPVIVTAYDLYGNLKTDYTGSTAVISDTSSSLTSSGSFSNGVWTGTVTIDKTWPGNVITITDSSGTTPIYANTDPFNVNPGALGSFTISSIDAQQVAGNPIHPTPITITAFDVEGNLKTDYTGATATITDTANANPTVTGSFTNGVWSGNITISSEETSDAIVVSDSSGPSTISATSSSFVVGAGTLGSFKVSLPGSQVTAGSVFTVTVTALNQYGAVITSYYGSVILSDLSGTGSLVTVGSGVFSQGVLQLSVSIKNAYLNDVITAQDQATGMKGSSTAFNVVAGTATKLAFTAGTGQSIQIGVRSQVITVSLEDAYGNPTTYTSAVTVNLGSSATTGSFYSVASGGTAITSVSIAQGQTSQNFYYQDSASGSNKQITASDNAKILASAQMTINIDDYQLSLSSTTQNVASGARLQVTVSRSGGGLMLLSAATVTLTASDGTGQFYTAATGGTPVSSVTIGILSSSTTVYFSDSATGSVVITATANDYTTATLTVNVYTPIFGSYQITASGGLDSKGNPVAGDAFTLTVTALDQNGQPYSGTVPTVTLTVNSGTITPQIAGTFTSGISTNSASLSATGSVTITATDTNGKTGKLTVTVDAPTLDRFTITASPSGTIGTQNSGVAFNVKITAYDQLGDVMTSYAGTPTLSIHYSTAAHQGVITLTSPTGSINFSQGSATVSVTLTNASTSYSNTGVYLYVTGYQNNNNSNTFTVNHA